MEKEKRAAVLEALRITVQVVEKKGKAHLVDVINVALGSGHVRQADIIFDSHSLSFNFGMLSPSPGFIVGQAIAT
jgi:hypothetical protein